MRQASTFTYQIVKLEIIKENIIEGVEWTPVVKAIKDQDKPAEQQLLQREGYSAKTAKAP